jgi:mxaK protein
MAALNRKLPAAWWLLLGLCLILVTAATAMLVMAGHRNALAADPANIAVEPDTPARLVFAKAWWLAREGHWQDAQKLYRGLSGSAASELRERASYNLGTLYLEQAAALWNPRGVLEYTAVTTLVELAKDSLREALRLNPGNLAARYNLEYAYRITPPPKEKPKADFKGSKPSVFATMPGIPGGGP